MEIRSNRFEDASTTKWIDNETERKENEKIISHASRMGERVRTHTRACAPCRRRRSNILSELNKFLKLILFDNWFIKVVVTRRGKNSWSAAAHTLHTVAHALSHTLWHIDCGVQNGDRSERDRHVHVLNNRMKNWINWNGALLDIAAYIMGLHEIANRVEVFSGTRRRRRRRRRHKASGVIRRTANGWTGPRDGNTNWLWAFCTYIACASTETGGREPRMPNYSEKNELAETPGWLSSTQFSFFPLLRTAIAYLSVYSTRNFIVE